ncbi:MAG: polysaccharide deacetylase family protein [Burkholderiales bacterium]|nr:polysaccharide deacetylase family protein [Burkholderiales bacterium]
MSPRCVILMYHVIGMPRGAAESRLCCPPENFVRQMECLSRDGWNVIPLSEYVLASARNRPVPERSAVITFDDGTACTHEQALPVLKRFGFPATVFVVSGLIGGRNEWMTRLGHPERRMLTAGQLRELDREGVTIGSHTVNHVRLAGLDGARLGAELVESRQQLEDILGKPVLHFAFPYGSRDASATRAVREAGYESACTTRAGLNRPGADPFALHRTEIMGGDSLVQFKFKLRIGSHDMPPWSLARAAARRWLVRAGVLAARDPSARTAN